MHRRLLAKFLVIADAQVAEICAARTSGDLATLAREAHALKSAARSVGAWGMGHVCETLETAPRAGDIQKFHRLADALPEAYAAPRSRIKNSLSA